MLRETEKDAPGELILTPRNGGPSPPNPNASRDEDYPAAPQVSTPVPRPGQGPRPPPVYAPPPTATQVEAPPESPADPPASDPASSDPASPNGVKSPQQVYQELQQLQQQQAKPQ